MHIGHLCMSVQHTTGNKAQTRFQTVASYAAYNTIATTYVTTYYNVLLLVRKPTGKRLSDLRVCSLNALDQHHLRDMFHTSFGAKEESHVCAWERMSKCA